MNELRAVRGLNVPPLAPSTGQVVALRAALAPFGAVGTSMATGSKVGMTAIIVFGAQRAG